MTFVEINLKMIEELEELIEADKDEFHGEDHRLELIHELIKKHKNRVYKEKFKLMPCLFCKSETIIAEFKNMWLENDLFYVKCSDFMSCSYTSAERTSIEEAVEAHNSIATRLHGE